VPALATAPAPLNNPLVFIPVSETDAFPRLGVVVQDVGSDDSVHIVHLASTFPGHQRFERRIEGQTWTSVTDVDVLPVGVCRVEYRSVDAVGSLSASAVL